jgi:lipoic acid synthetase
VDILTVGQYLRPTPSHLPVERYWSPEEFAELKTAALDMGFRHVECGPLVRSSYHAEEQAAGSAPRLVNRGQEASIIGLAAAERTTPGNP